MTSAVFAEASARTINLGTAPASISDFNTSARSLNNIGTLLTATVPSARIKTQSASFRGYVLGLIPEVRCQIYQE